MLFMKRMAIEPKLWPGDGPQLVLPTDNQT